MKRNGSNILLVGSEALDAACERLLGESSAGPRYRLFVTTDARPGAADAKLASVESGLHGDEAVVVDWQADVRGSRAADGPAADGPPFRRVSVESDDLRELGETVEETIAQFDPGPDGFSPAELRLCFDSITPLVADYDERSVRRFLLGLTETVERFDGMAHYHLPVEYDSEAVRSVEPLFDAVVEVQYGDGGVEQRWHLTDPDFTTDWLSL
ncbi:hypothetical protein [Halorussus sp. MSC15.2]|uniref:DUF7504 family protein n=1 Tax=Halorussus sp. MSC15.2 TaxID=2283638 RepID=UPI0013D16F9D|nr:hypothetical protein [Halorussus sp. MSC15.2]NEU57020.1 hypothetical protein [Halorussus sp. MSC15.2]